MEADRNKDDIDASPASLAVTTSHKIKQSSVRNGIHLGSDVTCKEKIEWSSYDHLMADESYYLHVKYGELWFRRERKLWNNLLCM